MGETLATSRPCVLVTGAGRGIGLVYARAVLAEGYPVAFADITPDLAEVVERERVAGTSAYAVRMDVSDDAAVRSGVAAITEEIGAPLVLVNNAALFADSGTYSYDEIPMDQWDAVMAVNVRGSFLCAKACLVPMREAGWGRIINISSTAALAGSTTRLHYVASKAAVVGLTRGLAREVGRYGVTVNSVAPGSTESSSIADLYPPEIFERARRGRSIPRSETPDDLVGAVLFLASDGAEFITGQTIVVDGGHVFL